MAQGAACERLQTETKKIPGPPSGLAKFLRKKEKSAGGVWTKNLNHLKMTFTATNRTTMTF